MLIINFFKSLNQKDNSICINIAELVIKYNIKKYGNTTKFISI